MNIRAMHRVFDKIKTVVADCRLSEKCRHFLKKHGINLVEMPEISCLDKPVSAHADMSIVKVLDKWFIADDVSNLFTFLQNTEQVSRVLCQNSSMLKYPLDAQFNCAVIGNNLICCKKSVAKSILQYAVCMDMNIIYVNQGYTKCSICIVDNNSIITEDAGIASVCVQHGIDVLKLNTREIKLDGYDYGFFGGCCGKLDDKLLFAGCIEKHSEYSIIYDFCKVRGVELISMSDEPLYDVGSIMELI